MYRPTAYVIDHVAVLHAVMREHSFATVAALVQGKPQFAYAPVVVDSRPAPRGGVRFHLARGNPLAELDGREMWFSFLGPNAYVSPDWYKSRGFVPTWNYIAIEASGKARALGEAELRQLLIDLSAQQEERLRAKVPWTIDRIPRERVAMLLNGICGFSVALDMLEGKFKLSQDKKPEDVASVIAGLESFGDPASHALAKAMRAHKDVPPLKR
jgi:transcriptional regulator